MAGRFSVRPSIADLNADFEAQFVDVDEDDANLKEEQRDGQHGGDGKEPRYTAPSRYTRRATLSGGHQAPPDIDTDLQDRDVDPELNWPAAATVSRSIAPTIRSKREPVSAKISTAAASDADDRHLRSKARAVRFTSDTVDPSEQSQERRKTADPGLAQKQRPMSRFAQRKAAERARVESPEDDMPSEPNWTAGPALIGGVQERRPLRGESQPTTQSAGEPDAQERAQAAPIPALPVPSHSTTDIWLDETGKPMSAFRKAKLLQRGEGPPPARPQPKSHLSSQSAPVQGSPRRPPSPDPSRDPGGGADPSDITALLASASAENEKKLSAMTPEEIAAEQRSVETLFGPEIVEMLRKRAAKETPSVSSVDQQTRASVTTRGRQQPETTDPSEAQVVQQGDPEDIRRRFFPDLAPDSHSALAWMSNPVKTDTLTSQLRFDFEGRALTSKSTELAGADTYADGLHHHEDNQSAPGYTASELIHLGRSTVAAQRSLALSVLGRIALRYPAIYPSYNNDDSVELESAAAISAALQAMDFRAHSATLAGWLLEDRQMSVAVAAVGCLRSCLTSDLPGPIPAEDAQPILPIARSPSNDPQSQGNDGQDWVATLLGNGLLGALRRVAPRHSLASSQSDLTGFIDILDALVGRYPHVGSEIAASVEIMNLVVGQGIKQQSGNSNPSTHASLASQMSATRFLRRLAASSRDAAHLLLRDGAIDALLRLLAPLHEVRESIDDSEANRYPSESDIAREALRIYTALGRYGLFAPLYMRIAPLITALQGWSAGVMANALSFSSSDTLQPLLYRQIGLVKDVLGLLEVWTIAATDPTDQSEEVTVLWRQAKDWGQEGIEVLNAFEECSRGRTLHPALVHAAGAAAAHACAFFVAQSAQESAQTMIRDTAVSPACYAYLLQAASHALDRVKENVPGATTDVPFWSSSLLVLRDAARSFSAASSLLRLAPHVQSSSQSISKDCEDLLEKIFGLMDINYGQVFLSDAAKAVGAHGLHRAFVDVCSAALEVAESFSLARSLQMLAVLQPGDSELALRLTERAVSITTSPRGSSTAHILVPFFRENLRPARRDPIVAPLRSSARSMLLCTTLVSYRVEAPSTDAEDEEEGTEDLDADEVDPMTGKPLWRSLAAGLPLRSDWPLLALDDLLQSADSAAFNRPGNMPDEWNENEESIVRTSLELMEAIMETVLPAQDDTVQSVQGLPSPSELLFALMKVFRLEDVQASDDRSSGAATGRDLFRTPAISRLLSKLFSRVRQLSTLNAHASTQQSDTLERAAARTLLEGVPFFQFYSDLCGLYDAVSFGDANFARAIIAPLAQVYAVDYRRLLWVDYASTLSSIRVRVHDAPAHLARSGGALQEYLDPSETDESILIAQASALASGSVGSTEDENGESLLYRISLHHCARAMWTEETDASLRCKLATSLLSPRAKASERLRRHVLLYDGSSEEEIGLLTPGDALVDKRLHMLTEAGAGEEMAQRVREVLNG